MQRSRKITAYDLLESVLFSRFETDKLSLNDHCSYLFCHKGIHVRKQSVDERFNETSILFIKKLLEETLSQEFQIVETFPFLNKFSRVRIKDATSFQLPDHLKDKYPGSGGGGSKAGVKIHFEYDLLTKQILTLDVVPFTKTDAVDGYESTAHILPNELVIRDLGYVSLKTMETISSDCNAYYLNRLKSSTTAFLANDPMQKKINFSTIESDMRKNGDEIIEFDTLIGGSNKLPVRMVVQLIPEKIKVERIRKRKQLAKKNKQVVTQETLARCGLNIFVTNIPKDKLPMTAIVPVYGIRWQIENIFKVWKSVGGIHKVRKMSRIRFEFYLYAKLIFLLKSWRAMWFVEMATKTEISFYKYLKTAIICGIEKWGEVVEKLLKGYGNECSIQKEIRKNRINKKSLKKLLFSCL